MQNKLQQFRTNLQDLSLLPPYVDDICDTLSLDSSERFSLNLALEEVVTNVMLYAYDDGQEHTFTVSASADDSLLTFTIKDDGQPFDPLTDAPEADTTSAAEQREIGGLGIHLVRSLMDSVTYQRIDNHNILTLTKKLQP